ncbi:MAG: hypothetical protein ABJL54_07505 [Halioglobus sp.]
MKTEANIFILISDDSLSISTKASPHNYLSKLSPEFMMLQHLGHDECHDRIMAAIESVLSEDKNLTRDMGGLATTKELGAAIASAVCS